MKGWSLELQRKELELVDQRRRALGQSPLLTLRELPSDASGVALSGGGIRSATFCLGLFQGLARRGLLTRVDYLSTVSGGGYFGGFFGRLFTRDWTQFKAEPGTGGDSSAVKDSVANTRAFVERVAALPRAEQVRQALADNDSPPLRWLRQSGNYMSPKGTGGTTLAAAIFTRNWLAVLLVMLVTVLTAFLASHLVRAMLDSWSLFHDWEVRLAGFAGPHWWWSSWSFVPFLVLLTMAVPLGVAYWLSQAGEGRQFIWVAGVNIVTMTFGVGVAVAFPGSSISFLFVGAAAMALLATLWACGLGMVRCFTAKGSTLLLSTPLVLSILALMVLPVLWYDAFAHQRPEPLAQAYAVAMLGFTFWNLALRAESMEPRCSFWGRWIGSWRLGRLLRVVGVDMVLLVATTATMLALNTLGESGRSILISGRPLFWAFITLSLMAGVYRLVFQVLQRDMENRKSSGRNSDYVALAHWLRSQTSRMLRVSLVIFGAALGWVVVDSLGQSVYALVAYEGGLTHLVTAIFGLLGIGGLGVFGRNLALLGGGKESRFAGSWQIMALGAGLLLAFVLTLAVSIVGHGIAWRWMNPDPAGALAVDVALEPAVPAPVGSFLELPRHIADRVFEDSLPRPARASIVPDSPGGRLYEEFFSGPKAFLSDDNLIGIREDQPGVISWPRRSQMSVLDLGLATGLGLILTVMFGHTASFLNLSSFHSFYTARLVRAYQGASNLRRWFDPGITVDDVHPQDDLGWADYKPYEHGGPLHLVNVALNCTTRLETGMQSDSAKGLNLCRGPAGLSFGTQNAVSLGGLPERVTMPDSARSIEVESLSLGAWVGVSGAAFTTGMGNVGGGSGTSFGTSLLCGLFNIRLGYWWRNQFSPKKRLSWGGLFPVQSYIRDEFFGEFSITNEDRWYLSDGGHFENTAGYELIRRRVPFILMSDAGADPEGNLDDIANLIRRVRLDFGAEIHFLGDDELLAHVAPSRLCAAVMARKNGGRADHGHGSLPGRIGSLDDLRPRREPESESDLKPRRVRAHAALAWVDYPEGTRSTLLFVKPGLTEGLSPDLLAYQRGNADFPQQTTLDQFFDESQWESYRKLGETVALELFQEPPPGERDGWWPARWAPLTQKSASLDASARTTETAMPA
jgi:hypothetical protein